MPKTIKSCDSARFPFSITQYRDAFFHSGKDENKQCKYTIYEFPCHPQSCARIVPDLCLLFTAPAARTYSGPWLFQYTIKIFKKSLLLVIIHYY